MLEARLRGLVGENGGTAVHRGAGRGPGSPAVLGRDALDHPGADAAGQRRDHAAGSGGVRAGLLVGGPGHDQLRDFHRHRQREGADRAARQSQAETIRPAADRAGAGGHPGRRDPADLARLPRQQARRHPVPRHDHRAARPVRGDHRLLRAAARGHDRRLRRRPEQRRQLRLPGPHRAGLHRVGAGQRLPGPDQPARLRAHHHRQGPVQRPDRLRHPPRRLRRRPEGDPDPLTGTSPEPGPRVHRHHSRQGRQEARRAGRHAGPRQNPPVPGEGAGRDREDHRQAMGAPGPRPGSCPATGPRTCG